MKNWLRLILVALVAVVFAAGFWHNSSAQRRQAFRHATPAHKKQNCSFCHKIPSGNWAATRGFPDVTKMPDHPSCIGCHKKDFFGGLAFCAPCHTNPSPRGGPTFTFPVRSRSHQFETIFPHDKHQNIIAANIGPKDVAVAHFVKASFSLDDAAKPQFNNCAICHETYAKEPKSVVRNLLRTTQPLAEAAPDNFDPTAEFFKNNPDTHTSCFSCHYQTQKPIRTDCAGCHRLTTPHAETQIVARYSIKYDHQSKNHLTSDCTSCHIRITQNADVKTMKDADVPILACEQCHKKEINLEIGKRESSIADKQPVFQCTYCHSSEIGRFPKPASHVIR
jgi:hypothetical protein